jgi:hypothetical protein
MKFSKFNAEGYYDPTAYEALTHMEAERCAAQPPPSAMKAYCPIVFICSPYADDPLNNERRSICYCRFAVRQGCIPFAPHIYFTRFLDDRSPDDRALGLFMGQVMLTKCVELWVFGSKITSGMEREIAKAVQRDMLIRYFDEDMREVTDR